MSRTYRRNVIDDALHSAEARKAFEKLKEPGLTLGDESAQIIEIARIVTIAVERYIVSEDDPHDWLDRW